MGGVDICAPPKEALLKLLSWRLMPIGMLTLLVDVNNSTHLLASLGPWHTATIRSIKGLLISKAFLKVSLSSKRFTTIPVKGNLP